MTKTTTQKGTRGKVKETNKHRTHKSKGDDARAAKKNEGAGTTCLFCNPPPPRFPAQSEEILHPATMAKKLRIRIGRHRLLDFAIPEIGFRFDSLVHTTPASRASSEARLSVSVLAEKMEGVNGVRYTVQRNHPGGVHRRDCHGIRAKKCTLREAAGYRCQPGLEWGKGAGGCANGIANVRIIAVLERESLICQHGLTRVDSEGRSVSTGRSRIRSSKADDASSRRQLRDR